MRFPSETEHSRGAPDELLRAEKDPRHRTEEAARRQLPSGDVVPTDYAFQESAEHSSDSLTARGLTSEGGPRFCCWRRQWL